MTLQHVAIAGSSGRMGRALLEAVFQAPDLRLHAALERSDSPFLGKDAGELSARRAACRSPNDIAAALAGAHVLIDFTRPEGTLLHLRACVQAGREDGDRHHRLVGGAESADQQAQSGSR